MKPEEEEVVQAEDTAEAVSETEDIQTELPLESPPEESEELPAEEEKE